MPKVRKAPATALMMKYFTPASLDPWISFADGDEHIKGNRENLQSQEEGQPVDRTRYKNHPQGCKENKPVKLIPGEISDFAYWWLKRRVRPQ